MEPNKIKAAAIAGAALGVLSVIPFINYCCCIWAPGAGFLASFIFNKDGGSAGLTPGQGATLGAMTGGIGSLVYSIIGLPIAFIFGAAQMEEALKQANVDMPLSGVALILVGWIFAVILLVVLSVLGGLIASMVFKPKGGTGYPPPPASPGAPYGQQGF
jgi:hypothetical protein